MPTPVQVAMAFSMEYLSSSLCFRNFLHLPRPTSFQVSLPCLPPFPIPQILPMPLEFPRLSQSTGQGRSLFSLNYRGGKWQTGEDQAAALPYCGASAQDGFCFSSELCLTVGPQPRGTSVSPLPSRLSAQVGGDLLPLPASSCIFPSLSFISCFFVKSSPVSRRH